MAIINNIIWVQQAVNKLTIIILDLKSGRHVNTGDSVDSTAVPLYNY